jgi:hypothetical protein
MSARSIGEHEVAIAPNDTPILVGCRWIDRDLGRFLHLVGNRLLDFGLAFQCAQDPTAEDSILDVEVCDLCCFTAVIGVLPL